MAAFQIVNSEVEDLSKILDLYQEARDLMSSKKQVVWPIFDEKLILTEIKEKRQWKLLINNCIACVWATTLDDELIWEDKNQIPSVYIHRIATDSNYRGQRLVSNIIRWADNYCKANQLQFVRLDTVGFNQGLIKHYTRLGFHFLGTAQLKNTRGLPEHYSQGPVCLFQRIPGAPFVLNYNDRRFKPFKQTSNSETSEETEFIYKQEGNLLSAVYKGGLIEKGHLLGIVNQNGEIDMRYHQVNVQGQLMTGICSSSPEFLENGKIRLHESWQWTSGSRTKGNSILEEI